MSTKFALKNVVFICATKAHFPCARFLYSRSDPCEESRFVHVVQDCSKFIPNKEQKTIKYCYLFCGNVLIFFNFINSFQKIKLKIFLISSLRNPCFFLKCTVRLCFSLNVVPQWGHANFSVTVVCLR